MISNQDSVKRLIIDLAEFYRSFEPNYMLGENIILTLPMKAHDGSDIPAGSKGEIIAHWMGSPYGVEVNMFFVGILLPNGVKIFGKHIWDKVASADFPASSVVRIEPTRIICPTA